MAVRASVALVVAAALALGACSQPTETAENSGTETAEASSAPAAGEKPTAFAQCAACHAVEAGKNGVGPSLFGVFGNKAGLAAGFAYSPAMKASSVTWDEATLDRYLTKPADVVPGGRMIFAGQADAAKRKALIDYLKTLK